MEAAINKLTVLAIFEMLEKAKDKGLSAVFVYKPNVSENDTGEDSPDLIVSNSTDAAVIAALLGHSGCCEDDDE